mgnify:FL=1
MRTMLAIAALALAGCAAPEPPETKAGGTVPFGYTLHCAENPDSEFCEENDDE